MKEEQYQYLSQMTIARVVVNWLVACGHNVHIQKPGKYDRNYYFILAGGKRERIF